MRCYRRDNVVFIERHLSDGLILTAIKEAAIEYLGYQKAVSPSSSSPFGPLCA